MGIGLWIGLSCFLVIIILFIFGACKISAKADRIDERIFQEWLDAHKDEEAKK